MLPWDIFPMAANPGKKAAAEASAKEMYRRLLALRDEVQPSMSNNKWTSEAGVSTSFFTNMQGESKAASEPSISNLRAVLSVLGISLPEFFAQEAQGRLVHAPNEQALIHAFSDALPDLPRNAGARAAYLASTVQRLLELPESRPSRRGDSDGVEVAAP